MKISIIIVSLNAGEDLYKTVESSVNQTYKNKEILIKDGLSTDGSLEKITCFGDDINIVKQKDASIYDAMNQAVKCASGDYYIFMNAGDIFADNKVLSAVASHMIKEKADIYYGDMKRKGSETIIPYPKKITSFGMFRNVPCHQVCFYSKRLFERKAYDTSYKVRSDYEHFLRSVYEDKAVTSHIEKIICIYEGEGFSETIENKRVSNKEHGIITRKYMGYKAYIYKGAMILTLQPLREKMANSKLFSGIYQGIKKILYR